jgi:hypothetical protein
MRIDDYDFENTARAVYVMNECIAKSGTFDSWEDLRDFMISMAYTYCYKSNSFSTSGFCLTAYDNSGERVVRASVSSFVAKRYVERVTRAKELVEKI